MFELHPHILKKNGKSEFVVLPYEEFVAIGELLDDERDLLELREAKKAEETSATVGVDELRRQLGLPSNPA
jgi:hypothetical protein